MLIYFIKKKVMSVCKLNLKTMFPELNSARLLVGRILVIGFVFFFAFFVFFCFKSCTFIYLVIIIKKYRCRFCDMLDMDICPAS